MSNLALLEHWVVALTELSTDANDVPVTASYLNMIFEMINYYKVETERLAWCSLRLRSHRTTTRLLSELSLRDFAIINYYTVETEILILCSLMLRSHGITTSLLKCEIIGFYSRATKYMNISALHNNVLLQIHLHIMGRTAQVCTNQPALLAWYFAPTAAAVADAQSHLYIHSPWQLFLFFL